MIQNLLEKLGSYHYDAIVVEGYDGVGKGTVLNALSEYYSIEPYRPDYNLWQQFDHRKVDRWKISGFFWDVFSHFHQSSEAKSMLFDRGVISGAVYNNDMNIAMHYKEMLRDMKVMHILVTCSPEDYVKFYKARNPQYNEEHLKEDIKKFSEYSNRYLEALQVAGVNYIVYMNEYDDKIDHSLCKSCGHYSYGTCRHPLKNCLVDGTSKRCQLSNDREVQDDVTEMYSMQS